MLTPRRHLFAFLALALSASVPVGCGNRFKTSVEWGLARAQPIGMEEAAITWGEIQSGRNPGRERLKQYNASVRDSVVQIGRNYQSSPQQISTIRTTTGDVELLVNSVNVHRIEGVDQVIPTDFVKVKRGFDSETKVDGVGASLIVRRFPSEVDPLIPRTGLWYPVTGLLNLDDPAEPVLELIDPTMRGGFVRSGQRFPLSANYTAAFARDFQDRQTQLPNMGALLRFEKYADRMGIYRMTSFDPDKEVCVLVHGINSTPMTWRVFLNEAYADPAIRERYEFWTFGYPTGAPIPFLASELREAIEEMQHFRKDNGASNPRVTLVGHSMGGLLSKAVTQRGDDSTWNQLFNVPINELAVRDEDRDVLQRLFYYEPIPEVKRVVFCATPHFGTQFAAKPVAAFVSKIVEVPRQFAEAMSDIVQGSSYALTPLGLELAEQRLSSIEQLRPNSRVVVEILNQPLNPQVAFHSIIGNHRQEGVPLEQITDGVVPFSSARVEGVVSEKIVHESPHGVHREPGGIAEIVRILKLP